jgi:hypothetical protein
MQYDFGWACFNENSKNREHLDVSMPNKVEYIACGLPVIAFPHKNIMIFLNRHSVGLVFNSMDEISSKLQNKQEIESLKRNVLNVRYKFTIEKNINKLIQYYKDISGE